jgi:hypothetical protein
MAANAAPPSSFEARRKGSYLQAKPLRRDDGSFRSVDHVPIYRFAGFDRTSDGRR